MSARSWVLNIGGCLVDTATGGRRAESVDLGRKGIEWLVVSALDVLN